MRILGNILWLIFGGLLSAVAWCFVGLILCITIIGIPLGLQCFKFASLSLWPFGRDVYFGGGTVSLIVNVIWLIFFGVWMAIGHAIIGACWCITIIGIPFGLQFFKLAKLSLMPFGAEIIDLEPYPV